MLGGRLGILFCLVGFFLVFLGWNGAATYARVPEQFPYLISGGIAGLGFIIVGATLMATQSLRADRVELRAELEELRIAMDRIGAASGASPAGIAATIAPTTGTVLAGSASFHRPDCRLIEGQAGLEPMTVDEARARGRAPCRVCSPETETA
jgi:hypothetical protein